MPEERQGMSREEAGRKGVEKAAEEKGPEFYKDIGKKGGEVSGGEHEMSEESRERMAEGARKGGEHYHGGHGSTDRAAGSSGGKMSRSEAGRLGGEASAGSTKHYTEESKERQIAGARKGGEHSHGGGRRSSSSSGKMSRGEAGRKGAEARWGNE